MSCGLSLSSCVDHSSFFFFFNDTATTEIYTLSLHDALPIYPVRAPSEQFPAGGHPEQRPAHLGDHRIRRRRPRPRSEEHTSELQSPDHLVCRLLLEKKKKSSQPRRSASP